ncbi:pentapeptide repeat-containing protein [Microcoleus sp. FACHB-1515]|uniref:pentapeptide repeat-containing protein n=1 Tax=Cyanophyceae TaxID=3028117 RepID=UPI001688E0AA|nr:pentapeptide repeat-containing protein [Microcoleus sp. FACHB-1515]MBD2091681.1 pentapeptide repeat-containing protein [Microcoleus sp. FACHB-1515]
MLNSIRCSIAMFREILSLQRAIVAFRSGIAIVLLVFWVWIPPAQAANLDQMQKLLQERICVKCDLSGADLKDADLRGVNLNHANLQRANLEGANLAAANLRDADLRKANLTLANLVATDFSGANLKEANISKSRYAELRLCHTIEPNGKMADRNCPRSSR